MILADTSCWIEYFHPKGALSVKRDLSTLIESDRLAVCGPVLCEILRGASRADVERLRRVLGGLHHLAQDDLDWEQVQDTAVRLNATGRQPPLLDLLIAVIAARHGALLCHYGDKHFKMVQSTMAVRICDLKSQSLPSDWKQMVEP